MALDDPQAGRADRTRSHNGNPAGGPKLLSDAQLLAGDEVLPCGRPLSDAWEQDRRGGDPHAADCPHCRQAVEELAALNQAIGALRSQEQPDGQTLTNRVMRIVRSEIRLGRMLPLNDPVQNLRVAENAAAKVLRRAADTVPGASAASCRITPDDGGGTVHVAMTLAATLDRPLLEKAAHVRSTVLEAADRRLGLAVANVDLEVVAVLGPSVSLAHAQIGRPEQGRQ